jgi:hypothetical protein
MTFFSFWRASYQRWCLVATRLTPEAPRDGLIKKVGKTKVMSRAQSDRMQDAKSIACYI